MVLEITISKFKYYLKSRAYGEMDGTLHKIAFTA
jgi:hypothetical protein